MSTTATDRTRRLATDLREALLFPFTTNGRLALAAAVAVVTYAVLVLSTFPSMSAQMLSAGVGYAVDAVLLLTANTYATVGATGLGLVVAYAYLTGVAVTNALAQVRLVGVGGMTNLGGVLPGLVASGCASCGAGVLGLLGFAGALTALPFHGNLVRVGGIALLLYFLARTGDPRRCGLDG
jgi:hypothetical protein